MELDRSQRIAMIGMYGGMWREFNPGCFMIAHKTKYELQKRLPDSEIDLFSIDNKSQKDVPQTVKVGELDLHFFGSDRQLEFLDSTIGSYDALVMGGDIIWGGDDVVQDNNIFFVNSPGFLASPAPTVLFNCVHTFYDDSTITEQKDKFLRANHRATYTAVRTPAIRDRLERLGLEAVHYVPDPVLDLDMHTFLPSSAILSIDRSKPLLGVSVRRKLAREFIKAMQQIDTSAFNVVVFPFSRQYDNLGALQEIRAAFGDAFYYFDRYLDPIQTYKLVGELDIFLNDTYHGNIASIIHRKPFISLDVEPELTSRKQQLLQTTAIEDRYNIRLTPRSLDNTKILIKHIPPLLQSPLRYNETAMQRIHDQIQDHFETMAATIAHVVTPLQLSPAR